MRSSSGFAMLFTVLIVSIILAIGISISNIAYKQTVLSSLAKDSQVAFYEADAGTECGLYYDLTVKLLPKGSTIAAAPGSILCGGKTLVLDASVSYTDYFVYNEVPAQGTNACTTILFDKRGVSSVIRARGFNICTDAPRQVERALEVSY
jgi:hypothetical protein